MLHDCKTCLSAWEAGWPNLWWSRFTFTYTREAVIAAGIQDSLFNADKWLKTTEVEQSDLEQLDTIEKRDTCLLKTGWVMKAEVS